MNKPISHAFEYIPISIGLLFTELYRAGDILTPEPKFVPPEYIILEKHLLYTIIYDKMATSDSNMLGNTKIGKRF